MLPVFAPETVIDQRYRVVRELGRGGFGVVLLCEELVAPGLIAGIGDSLRDLVLRPVALKVLQPDVIDLRRFATEVRALCRLNHPGIVRVYHYGVDPLPYLAMEYVPGVSLDRAALPAESALTVRLDLLMRIAEALGDAHLHGVIHRDIKPQNVLVSTDGRPRLVDFGLSIVATPDTLATLTRGSPGWMAPELLEARRDVIDHRVDIYGLGALVYFVFAGRSPFAGDGIGAVVRRQIAGEWAFPDDFPEALRELVKRCLAIDPAHRPSTAFEVADELRRLRDGAGRASVRTGGDSGERIDLRDSLVRGADTVAHSETRSAARIHVVRRGPAGELEATGAFAFRDADRAAAPVYDDIVGCWIGAEVSVLGASELVRPDGKRFLRLDGQSALVIDPYFPVTATDISKVAGVREAPCPSRALVDDRKPDPPRPPLVIGAIAHEMLERIAMDGVDERDRSAFNATFDQALARHRLDAAAAGMRDADIDPIRADLRKHFAHLGQLLHPERGIHRGTVTEARRISPLFGLEGRIDLALRDGELFKIIELKTGKRHDPAHEHQLRCYLMMWQQWAAAQHLSLEGHVVYSLNGDDRPLPPDDRGGERTALHARNRLVLARRALSHHDTAARAPRYNERPSLCSDAPCEWRRRDCEAMCRLLGGVDAIDVIDAPIELRDWGEGGADLARAARQWYAHFDRQVEREYRAVNRVVGELGRESSLLDRVRERDAIAGVSIAAIDAQGRRVWATCEHNGAFMVGDDLILHRADLDRGDVFVCRIEDVLDDRLVLSCLGAAALRTAVPDDWVLSRETPRIGFRDMRRAMTGLMMRADRDLLARIVAPVGTLSAEKAVLERIAVEAAGADPHDSLNASQRVAVALALGKATISLVHGPPGTGKTSVIAEIVARCVARGERVLLAACTNTAVDHALARIADRGVGPLLRVGRRSRASSDLLEALRSANVPLDGAFSEDLAAITPSLEVLRERIRAARVVAATANACVGSPVFEILEAPHRAARSSTPVPIFDVAVIDEASQLTEPLSIAPLLRARRVVLVGDARQLPPVVSAEDARSAVVEPSLAGALRAAGVGGLDRSLFERLQPFAPGAFLAVQYRMSRAVQAFASRCFYGDRLEAADSVAERRLNFEPECLEGLDAELVRRLDSDAAMAWVDCPGAAEGHVSDEEVEQVVRTAVALFERRERATAGDGQTIRPRDLIGIISPFRAQCAAIRSALRARLGHHAEAIEVDTVERFQGREKEIVLVSLVRTAWSDFVMDARRINVTFTRARSRIIVFGPRELGRRMVETFSAESAEPTE